VRARDDQTGKRFSCPRCGGLLTVPPSGAPSASVAQQAVLSPTRPESSAHPPALLTNEQLAKCDSGYPASTGIGQFMLVGFIAWAAILVFTFVVAMVLPAVLSFLFFCLFGALSVVMAVLAVKLFLAKRHVLDRKEVDVLFGLAKLVAWDPTEAVLILKNKLVSYVDDNLYDGGGIKLIYPILGDELACRAPLEIQTLDFSDQNVLTREYLPLTVQGTMKWRITDLQRFYLLVSKEIRAATDQRTNGLPSPTAHAINASQPVPLPPSAGAQSPPHHIGGSTIANRKLESVEQWLRYTAEEQTRAVVSRVNTGLLVAERVAADLPPDMREKVEGNLLNPVPLTPSSTAKYRSATEGLAAAIHVTVSPRVKEFGIDVHEVTLQEVGLPPHIHDAAVEACKAAYLPIVAQKQAVGRKMQLQAEADVIGAETVGAREVVSNAPAYALSDFLSTFLVNNKALIEAKGKQRAARRIASKRTPRPS